MALLQTPKVLISNQNTEASFYTTKPQVLSPAVERHCQYNSTEVVELRNPLCSFVEAKNINDLIGVDYTMQASAGDTAARSNNLASENGRVLKSNSTSHKGMKLKSYSIEFKLEVVEFAERKSLHAAEREYKVDRKSIRTWRNSKERLGKLLSSSANGCHRKRLNGGGRKINDNDLEHALLAWVYGLVNQGKIVTGASIISRAFELQRERHGENRTLNFSRGWLEKFINRNRLYYVLNNANNLNQPESMVSTKRALHSPLKQENEASVNQPQHLVSPFINTTETLPQGHKKHEAIQQLSSCKHSFPNYPYHSTKPRVHDVAHTNSISPSYENHHIVSTSSPSLVQPSLVSNDNKINNSQVGDASGIERPPVYILDE